MPTKKSSKSAGKAASAKKSSSERPNNVLGLLRKFFQRLCVGGLTLVGMLLIYFVMGGDSRELTGIHHSEQVEETFQNQTAGMEEESFSYSVGKPTMDGAGNLNFQLVSDGTETVSSDSSGIASSTSDSGTSTPQAPETPAGTESPETTEGTQTTSDSPSSETTPNSSPEATGSTPSDSAGSTPSDSTGSTPSDSTGSTPSDSAGSTPSDSAGSTPSDSTGSSPYSTGSTPSDSTGSTPSDSTGSTPSDSAGSSPYSTGSTPSDSTGSTPSDSTGSSPYSTGSTPSDSTGNSAGTSSEMFTNIPPQTPPVKHFKEGVITGPDGKPRKEEVKILEVGREKPARNHFGPAVTDFLDLFDFSITPDWIEANWSSVAIVGPLTTRGYRVPISTGPEPSDLVGSLTYYFDSRLELVKITFEGYTGELDRLLISLKYFNLTKRVTSDPNALLYLSEELSGRRRSFLKSYFRLQSHEGTSPNQRFWLTLELYPPEN